MSPEDDMPNTHPHAGKPAHDAAPILEAVAEPVTSAAPEPVSAPAPVAKPASRAGSAAIGGVVGAVLASGVFLAAPTFLAPYLPIPAPDPTISQKLAALESAVKANEAAVKAVPSFKEPLAALDARAKALEDKIAAAPAPASPSTSAPASGDAPDLTTLTERLAKLETAQAAPKAENRLTIEPAAAAATPALKQLRLAIAARVLAEIVPTGAPFKGELAAAEGLGADAAKIEALKVFATAGLPKTAALAADFTEALKAMPAPSPKPESAMSVWEKLVANASKLVKIRGAQNPVVAAVPNAEGVLALVSKGDFVAALALQAQLPDAARAATKPWADKIVQRQNAEAAAQGLWADALPNLVNP